MDFTTLDALAEVFDAMYSDREREVMEDFVGRVQIMFASDSIEWRLIAARQVIFVNMIGYQSSWAEFPLLEVISSEDFTAKRAAYVAASQIWQPNSDVVLMATNQIRRDLEGSQHLIISVVLSAVTSFMSPLLAQHIAGDVIKLMKSSKAQVKLKAIPCFLSVCLQYPNALNEGFPTLRSLLDDSERNVLMTTLSVFHELCMTNPSNFIQMIPKFFSMFQKKLGNWIDVKLIQILTILCRAEPRLKKKLVEPYTRVMESGKCVTVVYEVARSISELEIDDPTLIQVAISRVEKYVYDSDQDLRSLFMGMMMKLLKLWPKGCAKYRDTINDCLTGNDDVHKIMALELFTSMATQKNLDKIVEKMFQYYKQAVKVSFRNQLLTTVIEMCSQNDYEFVTDFDWYIDVLMDFVNEGAFTCYKILADQFLDLALRVPVTREKVTKIIIQLFECSRQYKDAMPLVLACAHIIGDYGSNTVALEHILSKELVDMSERVQMAFVNATMRYYLRAEPRPQQLMPLLKQLRRSKFIEVQNVARMYSTLGEWLVEDDEAAVALKEKVFEQDTDQKAKEEIPVPKDFNDPTPILTAEEDESEIVEKPKRVRKTRPKPIKRKARRQKEPTEKVVILKNTAMESFGSESVKEASFGPLSSELAAVKLDITEDEGEKKATRKQKKRKQETEEEENVLQLLGSNEMMKVSVDSVDAEENQVTLHLLIENQSQDPIPSIDVSLSDTAEIRTVDVSGIFSPIEGRSILEHDITVECAKPEEPHLTKLVLSPISCGGDSLEVKLRIFPTYFLKPADPTSFNADECTHETSLTAKLTGSPQACVRKLTRVLHSKLVANKETKIITMYSDSPYGAHLLVTFAKTHEDVNVTIATTHEALTSNIAREIEHAIKTL